jgi:hypothetical protein
MSTRMRLVALLVAVTAVVPTAVTVFRVGASSDYFYIDGTTDLALPVPSPEPVLVGVHLLVPHEGDTVTVVAIRPTTTEGSPDAEAVLYDPGLSTELIGMIVESAWPMGKGATFGPVGDAATFTTDAPRQAVLRLPAGEGNVGVGPIAVDFSVNGGPLQTQSFAVSARACFGLPVDQPCGDQP